MNTKNNCTADALSDRQIGEKFGSNNAHNNTHSVIHLESQAFMTGQEDILAEIKRQTSNEMEPPDPILKNIMGFTNESPLDQNFLKKEKDDSLPSNSPLNYDF